MSKNIHDFDYLALDEVFFAKNFSHQNMFAKESHKKLLQFSVVVSM